MSLDPVIHPIKRLRICAAMHNAGAVSLTEAGERALDAHLAALREIAGM